MVAQPQVMAITTSTVQANTTAGFSIISYTNVFKNYWTWFITNPQWVIANLGLMMKGGLFFIPLCQMDIFI